VQPLHMLVILETPPSPSDDALYQKRHFLNSRKTYHSCISYDHMSIPHTSLPTTSPPKKCTSPSHFSTQQPPCQNNTDNQNPLPLPISMPSRRKDRWPWTAPVPVDIPSFEDYYFEAAIWVPCTSFSTTAAGTTINDMANKLPEAPNSKTRLVATAKFRASSLPHLLRQNFLVFHWTSRLPIKPKPHSNI
jgi:hypothetical protein